MLNKTVAFSPLFNGKRRQCFPSCDKVTWGFSGPAFRTLLWYIHYLDARDPHVTTVILKGLSSTVLLSIMTIKGEIKLLWGHFI
jgi:hypothetical protein